MKYILIIITIILLFVTLRIEAAIIVADSCSQGDVETAIAAASNGDTVSVPSCPEGATWTSRIAVAKEITIRGQGTGCPGGCVDNTLINDFGFSIQADNVRIIGFTFVDTIGGEACFNITGVLDFRIDHNSLDGFARFATFQKDVLKYGVIDHNYVEDCTSECLYIHGDGNDHWFDDSGMGTYTDGVVFVEDNIFDTVDDAGGGGRNTIDSGTGAKWVFRYNTVNETGGMGGELILEGHGHWWTHRDGPDNAGTYSSEVYNNTFNAGGSRGSGTVFQIRGGRSVVFENTYTGYFSDTIAKATYWAQEISDVDPDGVNNCENADHDTLGWHDNTWIDKCQNDDGSPPSDYPCPGMINNSYVFNNGASQSVGIKTDGGLNPSVSYVLEDRDYWDDVGGGDTNFTSDVAANRPGTCTVDDCYWETDTRKLYRCTSTNTWTFVYEPFTYPHPLTRTTGISFSGANIILGSGIKIGP
jgi:hypothetical protein